MTHPTRLIVCPDTTGSVPAIGPVGLVVIVVLVLGAGAVVLSKRKQAVG